MSRAASEMRRVAIDRIFAAERKTLARQGAIVESWRTRAGIRHGPYARLTWRDAVGRQKSVYLGRDVELIEYARAALHALQRDRNERRTLDRLRHGLRKRRLAAQRDLGEALAPLGLVRRGAEIRGWRNLRATTPPH